MFKVRKAYSVGRSVNGMPDREKVETGFDLCANGDPCMGEKFTSCPFSPRNNAEQNCGVTMARNALVLLKEREPVDIEIEGGGNSWWYVCEECRGTVDTSDRFCRHCGRPFRKGKCAGCKDDCPQTWNFVCPNGKL